MGNSFNWADFLTLAQDAWDLSKKGCGVPNNEALRRSVIGRAYYSAFHIAKGYAASRSMLPEGRGGGSEHDKLWKAFTASSDRAELLVGNIGDRLKNLRHDADYRLAPIADVKVLQALHDAKQVCNKIIALRTTT